MRVALVVDSEPREVEVDLAKGTARIGDRSFPVVVRSQGAARIELEIAGEKVVVEGWYATVPSPTDPVTVNGERYRVQSHVDAGVTGAPVARPTPPVERVAAPTRGGAGTPVLPPMPGRVAELRVSVGDRVTKGQTLLVLEAMKMRNEIVSPHDGRVAEVTVSAGANVRAGEPMLRIVLG
jgi:glutaconyl-CoA/methylmalonyl-CoA decarboxylase subunit gamma